MELRITQVSSDYPVYQTRLGRRDTRYLRVDGLKKYLLDLGVGDSTIAAVLDMAPNESMTVSVAEEAA